MTLINQDTKTQQFKPVGLILIIISFISLLYLVYNLQSNNFFPLIHRTLIAGKNFTRIESTAIHHESLNTSQHEISTNSSDYDQLRVPWNKHPRSVIVTLIRSNDKSVDLAINMIHSVMILHSTKDQFQYPFLIFHDQFFTSTMRQRIVTCIQNNKRTFYVSFIRIDFLTNAQLPDKFI
ncbi:unnamed protein product [Adineta ricciae]|uniref:Uncharacterized protein n=1 Tax=Adineta ricciae TaxID=249248 RepID=A0A814CR73_ADIRI|nr:unnamed protein product [Adineta ricciae]CAF1158156.1 unnamed protein product [Adineta ricciae]